MRAWGIVAVAAAVLVGAPVDAQGQDAKDAATALAESRRLNAEVVKLYDKGEIDAAIPLAERALETLQRTLGEQHPDVAISMNNLAALHKAKGDYPGAERLYQRALAIREKAPGPRQLDLATSLNNLAALCVTMGQYARAEPFHRRALAIRERALGEAHPDVAESLNGLAVLLYNKGDHAKGDRAEAEQLYRRALAIWEKALGPEHPAVAQVLNNLAWSLYTKGSYTEAERLYGRALAIWEKTSGPEHPDVAQTLNNLAALHLVRARYDEAERLYRRALAIWEKALGPEHADVSSALNNLAEVYRRRGDLDGAGQIFRRALAIREKALGPEHPRVATTLHNIAALHEAKAEYAEAARLYGRALAIGEKSLGRDHPEVAQSLNNLAALLDREGDHAGAALLYERARRIWERALGPEHPDFAQVLNNLAVHHSRRGDHAEAARLYERALAIWEKALGPEHPQTAAVLNNMAELCITTGEYAKAEPLCLRALAIFEKVLGAEHPETATAINTLARVRFETGHDAEAERLYQRTLAIRELALGPGHPDVATPLANLAELNLARNLPAKAVEYMERTAAVEDRHAIILLATGSEEQKRAYMAALRGTTYGAVSMHARSMPGDPKALRLAAGMIVQRKGRVLDAMTDSLTALRRRLTPDIQERIDRLRAISAEYSAVVWRGRGDPAAEDYAAVLARLDAERRRLEDEMSRLGAELEAELRPISLEQVQGAIPEGAALLELFRYRSFDPKARPPAGAWGAPRYIAYVLRRSGAAAWADLGDSAPIDAAVEEFLRALRRPSADPAPPARALDALVMQPIRPLLGDIRQIFVSPDGALSLVPFAALRDEDGRFLVERYQMTYLTSGRDLIRLRARPAPRRDGPAIVFAPSYGSLAGAAPGASPLAPRSAEMRGMIFKPLAFASEEGRAVGALLPGVTPLTGAEATEGAVKALHGPSLLHIATHGFFLPDLPSPPLTEQAGMSLGLSGQALQAPYVENPLLRSGLAFAGINQGGSDGEDGALTALEASQLDLYGTRLVVLSACETGVGQVLSNEGVYGLRRALVIAGAETQVMSLWSVEDAAVRDLMEAYYQRLRAGGGRTEALRDVQLAMLRSSQRAHPYYWASFIVSGNPDALDIKVPVPPQVPAVTPGARGCCCELGAAVWGNGAGWLALLVVLVRWRRSATRR